jgi:hypothetical protein
MARAGDKDEAGPGASVAQLSDAASRHTEGVPRRRPRKRPDPPPQPDPNAGTGLISNLDAGEPDELVDETADDKLDQVLARQQSSPDRKPRVVPVPEAPERDPLPAEGLDAYQLVRDTLDHHHERHHPRILATTTPRGSAASLLTPEAAVPRRANHELVPTQVGRARPHSRRRPRRHRGRRRRGHEVVEPETPQRTSSYHPRQAADQQLHRSLQRHRAARHQRHDRNRHRGQSRRGLTGRSSRKGKGTGKGAQESAGQVRRTRSRGESPQAARGNCSHSNRPGVESGGEGAVKHGIRIDLYGAVELGRLLANFLLFVQLDRWRRGTGSGRSHRGRVDREQLRPQMLITVCTPNAKGTDASTR